MLTIETLCKLVEDQVDFLGFKTVEEYEKVYDSITEDARKGNFDQYDISTNKKKIQPGMRLITGQYFKYFVGNNIVIIINKFHD